MPNLSAAAASAALAAIDALLNAGTLVVYTGSMPATPETAIGAGNTALATWTFANPAFAAPTGPTSGDEQAAASFTSGNAMPAASGTAAWARGLKNDGVTAVADYTVTVTGGGGDVTFSSLAFAPGITISVTSFLHKLPAV